MKPLRSVAYARSGDKGNSVNIAVFARKPSDYERLCEALTERIVKQHFCRFNPRSVKRYELANLSALNFVIIDVLDGGGSCSLRTDSQGKAFGQLILELNLCL